MAHGPQYYEPKGVCIYCGTTDGPLSDEHIVPYFIGGSHVLREASCIDCARITSEFERRVARDLWGDARVAFDAPSRRKREREKSLVMPGPDGLVAGPAIPADQYPAGFVFYKMDEAGYLQSLPEDTDVSGKWTLTVVDDDGRRERFLADKPDRQLALKFRHVPDAFGRLLAKIGYCQVLTDLDPSDFDPICLPYILGEKSNVSYVVGGSREDQTPEQVGYSLRTGGFVTEKGMTLMAFIRLLANTPAPAYHVVVGQVVDPGQIPRLLQKLGPVTGGPIER